jgi:tetratricopeptide (TPR) repeat protein
LIQKHEPRMIRRVSDDRTGLSDYVGLLIDLHELIATDQGDSDEADALRDRMDSPWQRLSAKQRSLVDGLSADLYSLGSTRAAPAAPLDSATDHEMARAAAEDRWELVLDIVRRNEGRIPVRNVAYLRGVSWAHLGEPVAAIKFLKEAARLQSLAPDEEVWLLTCMIAAEQWAEAVPRARDIARTTADPVSLLQAAEVLFAAATYRGADVESLLSEAMIVAERGLAAAGSASDDDLLKAMRAGALLHMALTYDHRGDRRTAIQACRQALALDPERRTALELFGFLSYDAYPANQREPFRHRIQREVATSREGNVWPEPLGVS